MLGGVREGLRDDVVRADLDVLGESLRNRQVQLAPGPPTASPAPSERARGRPRRGSPDGCRATARAGRRARPRGPSATCVSCSASSSLSDVRDGLRAAQLECHRHEPLLDAVVEVALEAPARFVRRGDQPRARGHQLGSGLGVRDRGVEQLGESGHPLFGVGTGDCSPFQLAVINPHSPPSTTIGAATLECRPVPRASSARGPAAAS